MGQVVQIEKPYPPQVDFFMAQSRYIAYGGSRGGGKSWAVRTKAMLLALNYPGIQILLLRRTFPELRENHVIPLMTKLQDIADYKSQDKYFIFPNGSRLVLGYCRNETDVLQYQGQAYEVIFLDEATQFTEFQFQALTEINRSSGMCKAKFEPRMYFSCNPGGVGHMWVKRLFIDRKYRNSEREEDYTFVRATVYDNKYILENSPNYVRTLENLPENRRKAMLYGDWDIFDGQYFPEFNRDTHVIKPFTVPTWWRFYRVFDYGLDMLAAYIIAVDTFNNAYVIHEIHESNLIISDAARKMLDVPWDIYCTFAPPDLWGRSQESGKSRADIFADNGLMMIKSRNDRVAGWLSVKEYLKPVMNEMGEMKPKLFIFEHCRNLIAHLPAIQIDEKNPDDCASEPHDITHSNDSLRYFCIMRPIEAIKPPDESWKDEDWEDDLDSFINFGG